MTMCGSHRYPLCSLHPGLGYMDPLQRLCWRHFAKKGNPRLLLCQTKLRRFDTIIREHRFPLHAPHHNPYQSSTSQSSRDFKCSLDRTTLDVPFDPASKQGLHLLLLKFTWLGNHWGPCPSSLGNNAGASTGRTDDDNGRLS